MHAECGVRSWRVAALAFCLQRLPGNSRNVSTAVSTGPRSNKGLAGAALCSDECFISGIRFFLSDEVPGVASISYVHFIPRMYPLTAAKCKWYSIINSSVGAERYRSRFRAENNSEYQITRRGSCQQMTLTLYNRTVHLKNSACFLLVVAVARAADLTSHLVTPYNPRHESTTPEEAVLPCGKDTTF